MNFADYVSMLPKRQSPVKMKILERLWNEGNTFPRGWVKSSELLALTEQKYFDRRARELRDDAGCDIETQHHNGEHCWRLASESLNESNPRAYLTEADKKALFRASDYTCNVCKKHSDAGVRGLQADHKIPLSRGGSHERSNWQPLCNECNVAKRRACADCTKNCEDCSWAYPDLIGSGFFLKIPSVLYEKLIKRGYDRKDKIETLIFDTLSESLS